MKQNTLCARSQLFKSEEKNRCRAAISAAGLCPAGLHSQLPGCVLRGWRGQQTGWGGCADLRQLCSMAGLLHRAETWEKPSVLIFLHAFLKQPSVTVQLQRSSNSFLSKELMEVPRLLLLDISSVLKSSKYSWKKTFV